MTPPLMAPPPGPLREQQDNAAEMGHRFPERAEPCSFPCLNGGQCVQPESCDCSLYEATGTRCQTVPNSGFEREMTCRTWGQYNFETFDGLYYYFPGRCTYTLLRDCEDTSQSIIVQVHNDPDCHSSPYTCPRSVSLFLPWEGEVRLHSTNVTFKGQSLQLPHHIHDLQLEQISQYVLVTQQHGFTLAWDGHSGSVYIKLSPEFVGRTCGMCGNFNADVQDDLKTSYGVMTHDIDMFGNSWTEAEPHQARCPMVPSGFPSPCAAVDAHVLRKVDEVCAMLLDEPFRSCRDSVSPLPYMASCSNDLCLSGPNGGVVCQVFSEYARACAHADHPLHGWRQHIPQCAKQCPPGLQYRECISCCPASCNVERMCIDSKLACLDGCYCPEGLIYEDGRCVTASDCPCEYHGLLYPPGQTLQEECNNCTCIAGAWNCTNYSCPGECSVTGDMFFQSFDGRVYTFPATCQYVLAKSYSSGKFTVTLQNAPCGPNLDGACIQSVNLVIDEDPRTEITLSHLGEVFMAGQYRISLPFSDDVFHIQELSSMFLQVRTTLGLRLQYSWREFRLYLQADGLWKEDTVGLCGTFNGNIQDDFLSPSGMIESTPHLFGNAWRVSSACSPGPSLPQVDPCDTHQQAASYASEMCDILNQDLFSACHEYLIPTPFHQQCRADTCKCGTPCLCSALAHYARRCRKFSVIIEFRSHVPDCVVECPDTMVYGTCVSSCQRRCSALSVPQHCGEECEEGCICPQGSFYHHRTQTCVPRIECPCSFLGVDYEPGDVIMTSAGVQICQNGKLVSQSPDNGDTLCPPGQLYLKCSEGEDGLLLGTGVACEHTCESYLLNLTCSTHEPCVAGCSCPPGLLKHGDECFEPEACPCLWKGKEYYPGDRVSAPCHQCVCQHGTFQCEFRPCPSMCTAYGDRHYRTFDGLLFDYVGACKVYLVKSNADLVLSVTAENIDCYDGGVICRKSLLINVGRMFIIFDDESGKPNPSSVTDRRQTMYIWSAGYFTVVHFPEEDVTVMWDRKTTVHIQVGPRWQGKLTGLCGNFDLKTVNEMRTPDNIDSPTPQEFGNSWTASECVNSPDIRHPCTLNPLREPFAKRQCGILLSEVFQACHPVVDVTWFYMNCLADTCGCSRGGDCECFCTSVAAYAQRCCHQGVPVDWRSPSLCPYDCEFYNKVLGKGPFRLVTYKDRRTLLTAARPSGTILLQRADPSATAVLSQFMMTPGLSRSRPHDTSRVSFEAADRPNYFLYSSPTGHLRLVKWEESEAFWDGATFILHRDTWIPGYDSLESHAKPGFFIHATPPRLHLLKYRHNDIYRKATLFKLKGPGPDAPMGPRCQWRYDSCISPCFRSCSDPSGAACISIPQVEGCVPVCPAHMVLDEVTQRCAYVEDCIKLPVVEQPVTPSVKPTSEAVTTGRGPPTPPTTTTKTTASSTHPSITATSTPPFFTTTSTPPSIPTPSTSYSPFITTTTSTPPSFTTSSTSYSPSITTTSTSYPPSITTSTSPSITSPSIHPSLTTISTPPSITPSIHPSLTTISTPPSITPSIHPSLTTISTPPSITSPSIHPSLTTISTPPSITSPSIHPSITTTSTHPFISTTTVSSLPYTGPITKSTTSLPTISTSAVITQTTTTKTPPAFPDRSTRPGTTSAAPELPSTSVSPSLPTLPSAVRPEGVSTVKVTAAPPTTVVGATEWISRPTGPSTARVSTAPFTMTALFWITSTSSRPTVPGETFITTTAFTPRSPTAAVPTTRSIEGPPTISALPPVPSSVEWGHPGVAKNNNESGSNCIWRTFGHHNNNYGSTTEDYRHDNCSSVNLHSLYRENFLGCRCPNNRKNHSNHTCKTSRGSRKTHHLNRTSAHNQTDFPVSPGEPTEADRPDRTTAKPTPSPAPGDVSPYTPVDTTRYPGEITTPMDISSTRVCTPPYAILVDECTKYICVNNQLVLYNKSQNCLHSSTPPNCGLLGFAILVNGDKCCPQWDCPCRCSIFPDLNVITFDGNSVAIYKAASYIVTQLPNETVSVLVQECPAESESTLLWNFTNLCLVALNITHKSNHIVVNRLQRRLYVNSRYAKPRFKKFGFEVLDTGNMYLIRSPAGLKLQWFHSTGMMVIETESSNNKLPTMGLCGCCDGDPTNDLTLANGTTLGEGEDPAVFIDSWQLPNTTSYISHSRRREVNCSTSDCSHCLAMLRNQSFATCHAFVPPTTFCEVWVRDAEYVNNPCVALAAYAASCHKFNVCIEWRTPDYCPFVCPEALRYQACLPACTAQSCPNQDFDSAPDQCSGLTEGCVCPEGTLLHRPYSALCIPPDKCACTDSSGVPRTHGEVWKASQDGCCMYRCDNDSIVPMEYNCSSVVVPQCSRAAEVIVSLVDESSCCPQKACVCNQSLCDVFVPDCKYGEKLVTYIRQDSCCPDPVCECDPELCESVVPTCREDQTLIASRADGSCCIAHICVCSACPGTPPRCQEGEVLTVDINSTDRCCPVFLCDCQSYRCPQISCPIGMSAVMVAKQDQCCPQYTCVRDTVCVDRQLGLMRPGQILVDHNNDGICYTTQCTRSLDTSTGFYRLRSSTVNCSANCQPNQVYIPPTDRTACCGVCRNISCAYHNENGTSIFFKPGKTWVANCRKYDCSDTVSGPTLISYAYACPPFNETECMKIGGTIVSYMDGCCRTCTGYSLFPFPVSPMTPTVNTNCERGKEDGKSCQKVTVRMTIRKNDCRSNRPVNIVSCDGKCPSASIYNYNINTYARFCKCCREMGLQRRAVQLYCSGNSTWVSYSIQEPTDCSCQWS
ncbi:otogelin [Diretmus argenteus]